MSYDVIVVGGGVAGAASAYMLARAGARVVVIERERAFRDRVRGECILPWGVGEAEKLGLEPFLRQAGAREGVHWNTYVGGERTERRPLADTTPSRRSTLHLHHPELQQALLDAAAGAGAHVWRGVTVDDLTSDAAGRSVRATLTGAAESAVDAGLVVIADGQSARLLGSAGASSEPEQRQVETPIATAGVLVSGLDAPEDATEHFIAPGQGRVGFVLPLSGGRGRLYLCAHAATSARAYSGERDVAVFLDDCRALGVPEPWLRHVQVAGPLATVRRAYRWCPRPVAPMRALVGDAAGSVDPAFGAGLSLALRDVRLLGEALAAGLDQAAALERYASARQGHYAALVRLETWHRRLLFDVGAAADADRQRVLPRLRELGIDLVGSGPDAPSDAETERRLWA